ncbi:MAG: hypothetical protein WAK10_02670 [Methanoregula sp.]
MISFYRLLIISVVLTLLVTVLPVCAEPTVTIDSYQVTPTVLMPGDLGTIKITIKNTATMATVQESSGIILEGKFATTTNTDVNVFIEKAGLEGNGIVVIGSNFQRIGDIGPGQTIHITFLIKAPANPGVYFPEVWIDTAGGRSTRYPIPVNVNTQISVPKWAVVGTAITTPHATRPGDEALVSLHLMNTGQSVADRVIVRIGNASTSVMPKNIQLYHIPSIEPGETESIDIVLVTDRKTATGIANLPVSVQYYTVDGAQHTENAAISLMIKGQAEISIASIESSPERLTAGEPFNLIIRVENAGTGEAKSVSAKIDLPIAGTREAFLGTIKPGNDAPALFRLGSAPSGEHMYNVTIDFSDDWGNHTVTRPLAISVTPADYSGLVIGITIIAVLAIGAWYLFFKKKPGRNNG